jgi:hypothetical protein
MSNGCLALLSFIVVSSSIMHSGAAAIGSAVLNYGRLLSSKFHPDFLPYFAPFERKSRTLAFPFNPRIYLVEAVASSPGNAPQTSHTSRRSWPFLSNRSNIVKVLCKSTATCRSRNGRLPDSDKLRDQDGVEFDR